MIEIELFDGTILEFPEGTSQEVINRVAKQETMARRGGEKPAPETKKERTFGQTLYENIIGSGEVDTPGERLGQLIRGAGAATARGLADVPALPANLAQLGAMGVEKLLGMGQPSAVSRGLAALPETREMLAAVPVIGPESQYVAPGTAGKYISTAGEFAGGAGGLGGAGQMLRYGAIPGLASEAAGQVTEGTTLEPYARAAAAIAAPVAAGAAQKALQKAVSPMAGQIEPARQQAVEVLRREGIEPTAGQIVGGTAAENQLFREASTAAGRAKSEQALADFTAATMKRIGSAATRATPDALEEAATRIGGVFDDVVSGVKALPDPTDLTAMSKSLELYRELAPKATAAPIFKNINKSLVEAFRSGNDIAADTLKTWRSTLSKLTTSADAATRETAISAVEVIDDIIAKALTSAGKPEAIQKLSEARNQYRNLLAIESAASRAGVEGILSPAQLRNALLQQGRRRYVQGKGDLAEMTRAATDVLKPLPQSGTAPRLAAGQVMQGAAGGTGAGLGAVGLGLDPATATAIGALAALTPAARNAFLASEAGQRYFLNQLMRPAGSVIDQGAAAMLPGLLSQ